MRSRVLIVEDESLIAMAIGAEVAALGHHIVGPAASVAAAAELIGSEIIDCALVDYRLADGAADDLVGLLHDASVPFAWISGCAEGELPAGASAMLHKPIERRAMRRTLERLPLAAHRRAS